MEPRCKDWWRLRDWAHMPVMFRQPEDIEVNSEVRFGPAHRLNVHARTLHIGPEAVSLTLREYELLLFLLRHPGRVFSRDELIQHVWREAFEGFPHTVSSHINRLRRKIEPDPQNPRLIQTAWGIGYRFEPGTMSADEPVRN